MMPIAMSLISISNEEVLGLFTDMNTLIRPRAALSQPLLCCGTCLVVVAKVQLKHLRDHVNKTVERYGNSAEVSLPVPA